MAIRAGANVNHVDDNGSTPLQWACRYSSDWVIEALLRFGASMNEEWAGGRWELARLRRAEVIKSMGGPEGVYKSHLDWLSVTPGRRTKSATKAKSLFVGNHFPHIAAALFYLEK